MRRLSWTSLDRRSRTAPSTAIATTRAPYQAPSSAPSETRATTSSPAQVASHTLRSSGPRGSAAPPATSSTNRRRRSSSAISHDRTSGSQSGSSPRSASPTVPEPIASACSAASPATPSRIRDPSPDQRWYSTVPGRSVSCAASPIAPAASENSWCFPFERRSDRNVRRAPSGDHRAPRSSFGPHVTWRQPEPSVAASTILPRGFPSSPSRTSQVIATCAPSGLGTGSAGSPGRPNPGPSTDRVNASISAYRGVARRSRSTVREPTGPDRVGRPGYTRRPWAPTPSSSTARASTTSATSRSNCRATG